MRKINRQLPRAESNIWHRHPVWFINGYPIVGHSKLKSCSRLMFWSGGDFDGPGLQPGPGKFNDASVRYSRIVQVSVADLSGWLEKFTQIQSDCEYIYKRKGNLVRRDNAM